MGLKENHSVKKYISSVCTHIRNHKVHEEIKIELLAHIEEIVFEYVSEGMDEACAIDKAIMQMGDAELVGKELNKIHKLQPEWSILVMSTAFASLGLLTIYFIETKGALLHGRTIFNRSLFYTLLGMTAALGLYFVDYSKIKAYSKHIYTGSLLILFYVVHWGNAINGARRWLSIGPLSINFVAISPFLFVVALAGLFDDMDWSKSQHAFYGLLLSVIPAALILMTSSLSIFAIYCVTLAVLLVVSGVKLRYICMAMGSGFVLLLTMGVNISGIDRLLDFFKAQADPLGRGWLYMQLNKVTYAAGLFGRGFDFDPMILPEVHTDFIFAYILYTFGWIAGMVLAVLVIAFLMRMSRMAMMVKNNYGKLLISGFVSIFAVQFVWNILMNLGLVPLAGVSLPFISYGGSQFVMNMAAVGLILNVYKWRNVSVSTSM